MFHRDYSVDDGRYNNNGWLQEMPDPVTKIVWDNVVLISRKTARELGVKNSDLVELRLGGRSVRGPIWVQPGLADYSLGLALGYGREQAGRVGKGTGFNAYPLRTTDGAELSPSARRSMRTGPTYPISCTQEPLVDGRPADHPRGEPRAISGSIRRFAKDMGVEADEPRGAAVSQPLRRAQAEGAAPVGHVDRSEHVRGLFRLHDGLPEREQRADRRQGPGQARPRNALAAH